MELNVSDTQFIVVDDSTTWDANAVILKVGTFLITVVTAQLHEVKITGHALFQGKITTKQRKNIDAI